jgi:hypothetical protein
MAEIDAAFGNSIVRLLALEIKPLQEKIEKLEERIAKLEKRERRFGFFRKKEEQNEA